MTAAIAVVPTWAAAESISAAFYGAPVVALVVIVISFFTAKRRGGIAFPLCGWALLVVDVVLMAASVSS